MALLPLGCLLFGSSAVRLRVTLAVIVATLPAGLQMLPQHRASDPGRADHHDHVESFILPVIGWGVGVWRGRGDASECVLSWEGSKVTASLSSCRSHDSRSISL